MSIQNSSARRRSAGRIVYAAGAVLWRPGSADSEGPVEIAVIHRPRYDDWSLPKGKVDPGETAPVGRCGRYSRRPVTAPTWVGGS